MGEREVKQQTPTQSQALLTGVHAMKKIEELIEKGACIPNPGAIEIGEEVVLERISGDVTIHTGCRIFGASTHILPGAKLGYEGPVTVQDCQIGRGVQLKGGFVEGTVLLDGAVVGCGAHIREGTILEEQARVAHTVGLKHTILFPFVTLGSLINFCDCLMSGGSSAKNHSEVGSSYIHFNYTPNQDKATPSLFGDVPRGVMLDQQPIFLGGQGGVVGPCRLQFGTVAAAGTIVRRDELQPNRLLFGDLIKDGSHPYTPGVFGNVKRIVLNNIIYIANLFALRQWYRHVRAQFVSPEFPESLWTALNQNLNLVIRERVTRLTAFCSQQPRIADTAAVEAPLSNRTQQKEQICMLWPQLEETFEHLRDFQGDVKIRDGFLENLRHGMDRNGRSYLTVIQGLASRDRKLGTGWLQGIVDHVTDEALKVFPFLR